MLQWIATVPPVDLAVSRYSDAEIRYSNLTAGSPGEKDTAAIHAGAL